MADANVYEQVTLPQERIQCHNCGSLFPVEHRYCGLCGADYLDQ